MQKDPQASKGVIRTAMKIFSDNDPLRLAGATSFFTTFALPAILFLILQVLRLVQSPAESASSVFNKITKYVGKGPANHLFNVLEKFDEIASNPLYSIAGFLFLIFVGTTLFKVIKNSLNDLWDITVVEKLSLRLIARIRARELIIILFAAVLLLLSLVIEGIQMAAREQLIENKIFLHTFLGSVVSFIISTLIATCWFGIIFCFLPDARVPLKTGFAGAFLTAILFNIGRIILRYMLFNSNLNNIFGASASVVLLLLFVFYSSLIFYYGAAFTKALAQSRNLEVRPLGYAAHYKIKASKNE